ncbi:MAG: hypothetical protein AAFW73_12680 [Bacteroidota bacterium]
MRIQKTVEEFEGMRLSIVPPKYLQMIVTSVSPSAEGGSKLEVTYQEWKLFWN